MLTLSSRYTIRYRLSEYNATYMGFKSKHPASPACLLYDAYAVHYRMRATRRRDTRSTVAKSIIHHNAVVESTSIVGTMDAMNFRNTTR